MRKFIYLIVLFFTIPVISQESKNTIVVIGETKKTVLDDSYTILIALQQIMVYEGQGEVEATSLDLVRKNYINKLADSGIDFSRFRRNTYYEFAMSYSQNRESESYYLKTTNKEEVRKIINLKSAGVSISNIEVETTDLTNKQLVDLSIKAIDNAKQKAKAIAKKLNKTIGDIVSISDQNTNAQYIQNYGASTSQAHSVSVSFELK
ncbi:SIMPL domain-containing protein [Algibacter sp. L1A34]|uniref:SIMPL domain-containing protein n=1 Tax=Algibacter sp. L1A34 TaxID=2686365 RepID=UPI00131E81F9|nr:SIMPL domain-containing protein [Algibacter sp. L1A34]